MKSKPYGLLVILAILKFVLPFLLQSSVYEPHRDEFLYLEQGHHMAWGYLEVPPLLSVFAWLTHLFGGGILWIKLWPSLFGTAVFIVAGNIIISLGGKSFSLLLLFLPFIFGVYVRLFFLFQANSPEVFFWTMIAFSIIRFIQTGKNKWLYVFGISIGLGMMSKYSVAFFVVSILIALLLTKYRRLFLNKHFWYSLILGGIIFLPNLLWQYNHNFPIVHHMRELQQTQLQYINPFVFLKDQLLMNLPCFFIWLAGLLYVSFSSKETRFRFVGWAYVAVIVLFLLSRGKNYYTLGVYPILFAFGAYKLEQMTARRGKGLRYAFVLFPVALGSIMLPIGLPIFPPRQLASFYQKMAIEKTGALKWEDLQDHPLPQDFADMLGWNELTDKTERFYESLPDTIKENVLVYCRNYGQAGALHFYGRGKRFRQKIFSDNGSFLLWIPDRLSFKHLIFTGRRMPDKDDEVFQHFQSVTIIDSVTNIYSRQFGDKIIFFQNVDSAGLEIARKGLAEMKKEFHR